MHKQQQQLSSDGGDDDSGHSEEDPDHNQYASLQEDEDKAEAEAEGTDAMAGFCLHNASSNATRRQPHRHIVPQSGQRHENSEEITHGFRLHSAKARRKQAKRKPRKGNNDVTNAMSVRPAHPVSEGKPQLPRHPGQQQVQQAGQSHVEAPTYASNEEDDDTATTGSSCFHLDSLTIERQLEKRNSIGCSGLAGANDLSTSHLADTSCQHTPASTITKEHGSVQHDNQPVVLGMVGEPNVGKSSMLNVLLGAHRVAVSSHPGRTKHYQTHYMTDRLVLCDCPGLVFPRLHVSLPMQVSSAGEALETLAWLYSMCATAL